MPRKSVWKWMGKKADRSRREQPLVPPVLEPLEPRLLLSVSFQLVQPTQPATPEDYAIYISEHTANVQPTPEQTSIFIAANGTQTEARVILVFPDSGYNVRSWGEVQQQGNTFSVNAEVERWTDSPATVITTMAREYNLGTLADGDYVFEFRAWDQPVESREFRPGPEQWVQYVPTPEQTNIFIMADGAGGMKARVAIDFADSGYCVRNWGIVDRIQNTFVVNAEAEKWMGAAATVITPVSHDYDLGALPDGVYFFQFEVWQQPVESKEFAASDALKPVYRFWSPTFSRHFYTAGEAERDKLINNYSNVWTYEQVAYYALANSTDPDASPVYRFWSGALNSHFYTLSQTERDKLIRDYSNIWTYEGTAFYAYTSDRHPIGTSITYRFWSGRLGSHFFTTSLPEVEKLFSLWSHVWAFEGIAWYICGA